MGRTSLNLSNNGSIQTIAIPLTLILGIGTGGEFTVPYLKVREAKLAFCDCLPDTKAQAPINVATAADDLARIKATLNLTVTDLAEAIGVSRQAIYNWKSGAHIKSNNISKLANLKDAADIILASGTPVSPLLLDRKLPGGKTLLESIATEGNGKQAAESLLQMLRHEAKQRDSLDAMLANREGHKDEVSDYFAPAFDEG